MNERFKGIILSYLNIFIGLLLTLFYTPFLIRALGQNDFGLMSMASAVIGYLSILDLGFGNAIVVFCAKYIQKNDTKKLSTLQSSVFVIYLIMAVLILIIGYLFIQNSSLIFNHSMSSDDISKIKMLFLILTINLAISFPLSIYTSILNAYEKFAFVKFINIFRTISAPLFIIIGLNLNGGVIYAVLMHSVINLICILWTYLYYKKNIKNNFLISDFSFNMIKEIFPYSFYIFLGIVVDQINWNVDKFILAIVNGADEVAIYSVASTINSIFITLSVTISGVMLSKISKMVSSGVSNEILTDEFIKVGRVQFFIIFLILSLFIFFGRNFINFYAGAGYEKSYYITLLLITPTIIPLIQNLGIAILQAKNLHKKRSIMAFIMTIINLIISIPLAKLYGGIGSAIGTAISIIILNIGIMNVYYHRVVGLDMLKFWRIILKMFVLLNIANLAIFVILKFTNFGGGLKELFFGSFVYCIIYCIISYKIMSSFEREIIKSILIRIKNLIKK